ncbi:MAG: hypothetical protein NTY19_22605 [Planctomycetota bacterium]|nr:hypothetical protein [Planctomycetota bacterium]
MTRINYAESGNQLSESVANGPEHGLGITSQVVKKQNARRQKSVGFDTLLLLGVIVVLVLACGHLLNVGSSATPSPSKSPSTTFTPAQKLAQIDRSNVNATATAQMHERLCRLARNYGGDDSAIAAMLVKTQELLARDGICMTIGQIADSVEAAAPRPFTISMHELLALYVTRRSNNSDAATIAQMRALFAELGLGMGPPNAEMQRRYDELGIASVDCAIAGFGFKGLLQLITKNTAHR